MTTLIVTLHIIVCILLILIVLLQSGKGAEMGVSLGGGAGQTLFGAAGPATLLAKITTGVAIIFMLTSLTLAYLSGHQSETSVMKAGTTPAPIEQTQADDNQSDQGNNAAD
ncbi:preprotein translocase subunit SecG [Desulfospira joergensenii]|uniref:preprotein translocase subunit SecG n=1 Tax=Desulfospira joergensenii TaxID=53329 RepID=UPI0003B6AAF0|nr:preprotein translocase subunit SecG [Desulfospira joergensenii]